MSPGPEPEFPKDPEKAETLGEIDSTELKRLLKVALRAAAPVLSTSARSNLTDDVAARAIAEYWAYTQRGESVENPDALVATIAKRRALNARRDWNGRRDLRIGPDGHRMMVSINEIGEDDPLIVETRQVIGFLEAAAVDAGGEHDVEIARRIWIDAIAVEEVAADLGLAPKTVRNRMTAIKERARNRAEAW